MDDCINWLPLRYGGTLFLFVSFLPSLTPCRSEKKEEDEKVLSPFKQFARPGRKFTIEPSGEIPPISGLRD